MNFIHDNALVIYVVIFMAVLIGGYLVKPYKIDAKPLTSQTLFWLSIVTPFGSFLYFGYFAWQETTVDFSSDGFNTFIRISTLPLGLLSLAIPLTAIVNNMHRTVQTNKQIELVEEKNYSDFKYSHRKNAIEYFEKNLNKKFNFKFNVYNNSITVGGLNSVELTNVEISISIKNPYCLYNSIYTFDEDSKIINVSFEFVCEVRKKWVELNDKYLAFSSPFKIGSRAGKVMLVKSIAEDMFNIFEIFNVCFIGEIPCKSRCDSNSNIFVNDYIICDDYFKKLIKLLKDVTDDIFTLLNEDSEIKNLEIIEKYLNLSTSKIPFFSSEAIYPEVRLCNVW